MKKFRWNYSNQTLSLSVSGEKPVVIRGSIANELREELASVGKDLTEQRAEEIYRIVRGSEETNAVAVVSTTNEEVVNSLVDAGVPGVEIDDEGVVIFNDQPIRGAVGRHIYRTLQQSGGDLSRVNWKPMKNFFERLLERPFSTQQLFRWLEANDFSIASDGRVIVYRGVDSNYSSGHSGLGGWITADGTAHYDFESDVEGYERRKYLEYLPGSIVRMRREDCDPNGNNHCSTGIHFGTKSYASSYGTRMLLCLVDPADVVSIPNDTCEKARTCALEVVGEIGASLDFVSDAEVEIADSTDGTKTLRNITTTDNPRDTGISIEQ